MPCLISWEDIQIPQMPKDLHSAGGRCKIDNAAINIAGNSATTLGKVHFTNKNGEMTGVDKSWKFVKDNPGKLRIVVHHFSLEHQGKQLHLKAKKLDTLSSIFLTYTPRLFIAFQTLIASLITLTS